MTASPRRRPGTARARPGTRPHRHPRARAALHGGHAAQAGPRPGGGFGVRVSFPLSGGDGLS